MRLDAGGRSVYGRTRHMYNGESAASPAAALPPSRRKGGDNARRLLLLQTTLRLIADRGIDAVSHRAVATAADVPLGSTTYWFASRQDMLVEALEYFAEREVEALEDHLAGVLDGRLSRKRLVDEFTAILLPQLGDQRWRTVAQYALFQESARHPELQPACRRWTDAWIEATDPIFASLGSSDPALEARMFLAMLDGLLLAQLATPDPDPEATVIRPALKAWFDGVPARARTKRVRR